MSGGKIFLVVDKHKLRPLQEKDFDLEKDLQRLLVDYWDLLPGDQVNPENPRRWLLVTDEMGVPDHQDGTERWSLDHLFLDQDAIPTLVECKRNSDTRTRWEVVAQMLEHAANGSVCWQVGQLHEAVRGHLLRRVRSGALAASGLSFHELDQAPQCGRRLGRERCRADAPTLRWSAQLC